MSPCHGDKEKSKLTQQNGEFHKVPEVREPSSKHARAYLGAYLKAVAVVLLACFLLCRELLLTYNFSGTFSYRVLL